MTVPASHGVRAAMILVPVVAVLAIGFATGGDSTSGPPRDRERDGGRRQAEDVATATDPLRLWVGGDSLAAGPSWAVFDAASATGVVAPLAEYQVGTGIVRNEYWDWTRHLDAVLRARDPDVVVFMVGANDNQPLAVDGVSYQPGEPQWLDEYRRRVAETMEVLTRGGRPAIWIGMPPMRDPSLSAAMGIVNGIFAEEAAARGVTYVDAFAVFSVAGEPGVYTDEVAGPFGAVEVRLDDGIHLNVDGSRYLASIVMDELVGLGLLPSEM